MRKANVVILIQIGRGIFRLGDTFLQKIFIFIPQKIFMLGRGIYTSPPIDACGTGEAVPISEQEPFHNGY